MKRGRWLLVAAVSVGCAGGRSDGSGFASGGFGGESATETGGADGVWDDVETEGGGSDDAESGGGEGPAPPIDCDATPQHPDCDCSATTPDGAYVLGPCAAPCVEQTWRWSLWATVYNVAGTLGYGEHQGLGLIGLRYAYDPRFEPADGIDPPWQQPDGAPWALGAPVPAAEQFAMRTTAPGGETYAPDAIQDGDADDLWAGEEHPEVPSIQPHAIIDHAALCEVPEVVTDDRYYNHGRTLAERVPNHEWDSFFARRDLIPLRQLGVIEAEEASADTVASCLAILDDGFCEQVCGNCSYVMPTGFSGTPFPGTDPENQIAGIPAGSTGPHQVDGAGSSVAARVNYSAMEAGHTVYYVGGSSWGRPDEVSEYTPGNWPDPDGVILDPGAFMSVAGSDGSGGDAVPDEWTDPFTHCLDPTANDGSQIPASLPRFISGRWGHNSNTDAEATWRQFQDCASDPVAAVALQHVNANACAVCGVPGQNVAGQLAQMPCVDDTHTATSYWELAGGMHNVDDLDLGRFTAVGPERTPTQRMSEVPDPICGWSDEPVFGM